MEGRQGESGLRAAQPRPEGDAEELPAGGRSDSGGGSIPPPREGGRSAARRAAQSRGGRGTRAKPSARRGAGRGRKPERNVKKIIALSAAGVLVLLAGAGGALYYKLNGNIKTFDQDAVSKDRPPEAAADADGNKPVNILLIGSDSRGGGNSDLGGGDSEGARSDTTILLHVYADHKHAVGISIPRNTLTAIPPCKLPDGTWSKERKGGDVLFNAAFSIGGTSEGNPACTQNTVEKITGIRINHTVVVDFSGFAAMTKAVNGVDICLPKAIYEGDINPKLHKKGQEVLSAGRQKVEGQQALDYVRLRYGIGDNSDIGRMKRQQAFMSSMISTVKKQGLNPTTLLPLADAATKSLRVDQGLDSVDKLMSLALSLKNIDMHDLKFVTPPWRFSGENLELVDADAKKLWDAIKADRTLDGQNATGQQSDAPATQAPAPPPPAATQTTPTAPPAAATPATSNRNIKVAVYNGTVAPGMAGKAAEQLKAAKFMVTKAGTAPSTKYTNTVIEYGSGQKANAEKVAAFFPGATVEAATEAGIVVYVGKDFAAANGGAAAVSGETPSGTPSAAPASEPPPLPPSITDDARSADDDICAKTTY
ncbi:LCP family protein [Kitasatospora purpeofusca]|uniref:LCP family protein n=1 Tax=Kitasatospora purpeofusca TaxID=67352 RepID=UPI0036BCA0B9